MELIIAMLSGAAGGSLINGLSPKIAVSGWLSLISGMAGGVALYWVFTKLTATAEAAQVESADIYSLLGIMLVGFAGGVLALLPVVLIRWRKQR